MATTMSAEIAIQRLRECAKSKDTEMAHVDADIVLCDLLEALGYIDVVTAFHEVPKWYV